MATEYRPNPLNEWLPAFWRGRRSLYENTRRIPPYYVETWHRPSLWRRLMGVLS